MHDPQVIRLDEDELLIFRGEDVLHLLFVSMCDLPLYNIIIFTYLLPPVLYALPHTELCFCHFAVLSHYIESEFGIAFAFYMRYCKIMWLGNLLCPPPKPYRWKIYLQCYHPWLWGLIVLRTPC